MMTAPRALPTETEAQFESAVLDLARFYGWRAAHFRPAQTGRGWRTPVAADGKGWPDWVFARERVVFAELKSQRGRLSPEQSAWLDWLKAAGGEVYCWRPSDWDDVIRILGPAE